MNLRLAACRVWLHVVASAHAIHKAHFLGSQPSILFTPDPKGRRRD